MPGLTVPLAPPRFAIPLLGVLAGTAAASFWADRTVLVGLYEDFHYGLTGLFSASLAGAIFLATQLAAARREDGTSAGLLKHRKSLTTAVLLGSLVSLVALEQLTPDVFGPSRSVAFAKLTDSIRKRADFDSDGYSSVFGGSDCAAFDAEIRPGKFDMPGDSIDDDCSGTAAQWPTANADADYPRVERRNYNVWLVTIDALRADHIGAWGYDKNPTTPNIDRLASGGIRFAQAFAPAPKTYESIPSLATGLYPANIPRDYKYKLRKGEKRKPYRYRITDEVPVLPEILRDHGYVASAAHGVSLFRALGLDRGFEEYVASRKQSEFAIDFLERKENGDAANKPFLLWLHYYSPHAAYEKRDGFDFGDAAKDRYDSEIAYDDAQIGRVLDELSARGLADNTIVVLTADHGEEFGDHGGTFHGSTLYRELIHVPLIVKIPGVPPQVVNEPVELADVAPTLCEVLAIAEDCPNFDGRSLVAAMSGVRDLERGAYGELYFRNGRLLLRSLFTAKWHVIEDYKNDRVELYDVIADKEERTNLARKNPELVRRFRDELAVRYLYRQGLVVRRYEEEGDSLILAKELSKFRRARMLTFALDCIGADLKPAHKPYLSRLLERPGLPKKLKARVKKLLKEL